MSSTLSGIDALILAGGRGSRLKEVLGDLPKALAPINGRPFLDYQLEYLAGQGVRKVVLALGYQANLVLEYLERTATPVAVEAVIEPNPLGTAGAIGFAKGALKSDPVLVINGDTWLDIDLAKLLQAHTNTSRAVVTITCVTVDDPRRYGTIELSPAGTVRRFLEKEQSSLGSGLINGGVYMLSARFLSSLTTASGSLEYDVLPRLDADIMPAFLTGRTDFIDIGTPESYISAVAIFQARTGKTLAEERA